MTDKTLRALAKDYANGVLNKEAYRKARDSLLNGILTGKISLAANEYRAPLQSQDLNSTFEKTAIQVAPPPKEPRPTVEFVPPERSEAILVEKTRETSSKPYMIAGIFAATMFILAIAYLFLGSDDLPLNSGEILTPEVATEQNTINEEPENITASELINGFLNRHDWSDEQLQQFISQWNNLSPEETEKGLTPPLSIQLANAIYKQLLEERSLFGTGIDDAIIARQQALVDFANALGMDDPRLQVRQAPPSLSANQQPEPAESGIKTSDDAVQ